MSLMHAEKRDTRTASAQRRQRQQVRYLCDQVQVAVAEHKPQSIIDELLNELSQASGKARIAS